MKEIYYECSLDFLGVHYHISEIKKKLYDFISQNEEGEDYNGEIKLYSEIYECYFLNKKIHRDNGPAFIRKDKFNEYSFWFQNGKIHRDDGPAYECQGDKIWFKNNRLHRDNGPASITSGSIEWFFDGVYHRNGAPAVLNVKKLKDVNKKSRTPLELNENGDIVYIMIDGVKTEIKIEIIEGVEYLVYGEEWWENGKRHRKGGPADTKNYKISTHLSNIVYIRNERRDDNGIFMKWYVNGELHRTDGPAIILPDGEMWYVNGKLHRYKEPAVIRENREDEWWLNGIKQNI